MNDYDKNIKFEIYNSWEVIVMIDVRYVNSKMRNGI